MTCILTLGHSDRAFADVLKLLRDHDVRHLVDVRRFPGSRKHPQWNRAAIVSALPSDMRYTWIPELGGRRRTPADASNPNGAWRVKAFQGYADHMLGEEFADGLAHLISLSAQEQTAVMCSEAVPWRCHRRLITDALLVAGIEVHHIISGTRTTPGALSDHAQICDGQIIYPLHPK